MFGWLKRKSASSEQQTLEGVTTFPDAEFVHLAETSVCGPRGDAAMIVVALANLGPVLSAIVEVGRTEPYQDGPKSLDELIEFFAARVHRQQDEVGSRRTAWFLFASIIRRATELAERNRTYEPSVAQIWIRLAEGGALLPHVLKENILWSESEKDWFKFRRTESDGRIHVISIMMPRWLRDNPEIREFAKRHDFNSLIMFG